MPKPGESILWKQYGFHHIIRDEERTLCGFKYGWDVEHYRKFSKIYYDKAKDALQQGQMAQAVRYQQSGDMYRDKIKYGKDAEHRPLCGVCRNVRDKKHESK